MRRITLRNKPFIVTGWLYQSVHYSPGSRVHSRILDTVFDAHRHTLLNRHVSARESIVKAYTLAYQGQDRNALAVLDKFIQVNCTSTAVDKAVPVQKY